MNIPPASLLIEASGIILNLYSCYELRSLRQAQGQNRPVTEPVEVT